MRAFAFLLVLAPFTSRTLAAAIDRALYEASDPTLSVRDAVPTCGGDEHLSTCGSEFPSTFCCPGGSTCILLNANDTTAAICCPKGSDCGFIEIIDCDKSALDPVGNPSSPVHASPVIDMPTCGSQCCPPGYECNPAEDRCKRIAADAGQSATTTSLPGAASTFPGTSSSMPATSTISSEDSGITVIPTASSSPEADASHASTSAQLEGKEHFSGKSFAAGFVPGIFLGLLVTTAIIWFIIKQRRRSDSRADHEKRDTLTPVSRSESDPNMRSISDPIARESYAYRTEFSRGQSPPRLPETDFCNAPEKGSNGQKSSPQHQQKVRPLFSRSPMTTPKPTQSPLPQHCNRGTINWPKAIPTMLPAKSFHISPIRGLNRKKSVNSLRRHARTASAASDASTRRLTNTTLLNRKDSEASTGTIKMSFPEVGKYASPDMRKGPQQYAPQSTSAGNYEPETFNSTMYQSPPEGGFTSAAASSRYAEDESPHERAFTTAMIPPPIPLHIANPDFSTSSSGSSSEWSASLAMQNAKPQLGSPYTPTRKPSSNTVGKATRMLGGVGGGLTVQREPEDRPSPPAMLGVPASDAEHDARRDTTFSGMMRKAGLTDSYLYVARN
ncbi:hypothetical protein K431DRAFT_347281 [Polychaeton citri CBS 116435]|uniref:Uncharacterized protein n=1 Tax=Polychaeton citri CBS 116435 TaxID=1314669 RepID=A0A9P4Q5Q5_9PEZI|nr:hypothetical protein K431DRAFT_347281 [Polychaeton citri CBS 116435]